MIFQILDANYTYGLDKKPLVQLFGRTPDGSPITCQVSGFRPYFYVGPYEGMLDSVREELVRMGLQTEIVKKFEPMFYQPRPTEMLKVTLDNPKEVRDLREEVRGIQHVKAVYETDIQFKNRFLVDKGIGGMSWVEAGHLRRDESVDVKSIRKATRDGNAPLKFMSFDIECLPSQGGMPDPKESPVILISMAFEPAFRGRKSLVLIGKKIDCKRPDILVCGDEVELLYNFATIIRNFDPDIIAGYNSNEFDIPYLDARAKELGPAILVGRDGKSWYIRQSGENKRVSITGRVVVDLLPIIRASYSLKRYTLRNAAAELLKMEKLDVDPKEIESLWKDEGEGFRKLVSYARRDAELALHLLLDLRLIDKYIALSKASGLLLQDTVNGGQSGMIESLLLRRFKAHNRVVFPKPDNEDIRDDSDELKGAVVLDPEKGLLENVVILDYRSLYPTIMISHNICFSTVLPDDYIDEAEESPSGGKFVKSGVMTGIVPEVLRELLDQRLELKRAMKTATGAEYDLLDAEQYAVKILLNSFYGYSGYVRARLYNQTIANSVTSWGRENIQRTRDTINDIGTIYIQNGQACLPAESQEGRQFQISVVYGDTDSVFVRVQQAEGDIEYEDAELIGRKIAEVVTSKLPRPMELVFESFARRAIFLAKKRYALYLVEPGKDKIKVKGMETVRRDWCELTSKTLKKCLELLLKEGKIEEARDYAASVIDTLACLDLQKNPGIVDDLILTRKFSKPLESYANIQPHVQLIKKLQDRGGQVPSLGDRVPFVIVRKNRKSLFVDKAEDPQYAIEHSLPLDTDYYIQKQILPPVLRIFETFGITEADLSLNNRQCKLADF